MQLIHDYRDLISIFNDCFSKTFNTQLLKGEDEPIYLPADDHRPFHAIYFAHGFFSSALHECAHWLIAGQERRQKIDYGYWYEPDGRNAKQQELFQRVEAKPQALEWILSVAAGYRFRISIDNLNGPALDTDAFRKNIYREVKNYCQQGLPERARMFRAALCDFYGNSQELAIEYFKIEDL